MAVQVASLVGVLRLDDSQFRQGMQGARQELSSFGDATRRGLDGLRTFGTNMALLSAPILAVGASGLRTASDFDAAMRMISGRTGLVGDDLQQIADFAIQMGADTIFSAQEAADAFLQLLSSGQSAEQAIATLPSVLDLAAASGDDLGRTADTLTDIMAAFGLAVEDATFVSDVLARAAASSSADVSSLGQGFANVGNVAQQFGLGVEETAAILAIFSENGIKGAEAGTQLRSMLLNMTRPTEAVQSAWAELGVSFYDSEQNARPLAVVIGELDRAMSQLPAEEQNRLMHQLAGSYGIMGLSALRGSISMEEMVSTMQQQASASDIAAIQMGGFGVSVDSLKGSIDALMIEALTPLMNEQLAPLINNHLIPAVGWVQNWIKENPELARNIIVVTGAVTGFSVALFAANTAFGLVSGAIKGLLVFALSPLGLALAVGAGLVAAYLNNWMGFRDFVDGTVRPALERLLEIIRDVNKAIDDFIVRATGATETDVDLARMVGAPTGMGVVQPFNPGGVISSMPDLFKLGDMIARMGAAVNHDYAGRATAGEIYMIGTQEIFRPHVDGDIIPIGNGGGDGGGGGVTIQTMNVYTNDAEDFMRQMEDIRRRRG